MRPIGICVSFSDLPEAHRLGYDFVEASLVELAALPEYDFLELADYIDAAGISIRACYDMLPADMRITGAGVSAQAQHEYLTSAFSRASRLGVKVIAMDCGSNRHVPDENGFPAAWRQLGNFMRLVQGHASNAGLQVAIEPIRKSECNILNLVSEATLMAGLLQLDNVGVLANTGSMAMASEPLSALRRAMPLIRHVHLEGALRKGLPAPGDGENYEKIFGMLNDLGYEGGVSIRSGYTGDFSAEAKAALEYLRKVQV